MSKSISNTNVIVKRSMPKRAELPPVKEFTTTATKSGTGAHVTVPKAWLDKRVYVKLVEEDKR